MSKKGMSVSGLANIGQLLDRAEVPAEQPKVVRGSKEAIVAKTTEGIREAYSTPGAAATIERYITAAVREAFNLGHAEALDQNGEIERLINKRFDAKTQMAMPAICASVMEHLGMTELTLELNSVATIFDRCRVEFEASDDGGFITYFLRHKSDDAGSEETWADI